MSLTGRPPPAGQARSASVASASAASASSALAPAPPRTFLAFDFGTRRIGVATGNSLTRSATPLGTVTGATPDARLQAIGRLITDWQPAALVVGVPFHPDGAAHDNTARARRFGRQLHGRFRLPVHEVDERYTTTEAASGGARDLDAAAAAIILTQFLNALPPADLTADAVRDRDRDRLPDPTP